MKRAGTRSQTHAILFSLYLIHLKRVSAKIIIIKSIFSLIKLYVETNNVSRARFCIYALDIEQNDLLGVFFFHCAYIFSF